MGDLGYVLVPRDDECHLCFYKEPGLCFELHHALFECGTLFYGYYENPWAHARARGGDEVAVLSVLGTAPGKVFSSSPPRGRARLRNRPRLEALLDQRYGHPRCGGHHRDRDGD